MYKRILLALDLEGVNFVVGKAYAGLEKESEDWYIAIKQAALEINAAAESLFEAGAEKVSLWDNHAGGGNIDPEALDKRIELIATERGAPRMNFAKDGFDCVCFFGYHTMEGTLGGVLAHTMSSKTIQYYKLNGKHIGEVDMDAFIAASYNLPSVFFAGGDIACAQAKRALPHIVTVETKKEIERNKAVFRDNEELLSEIKKEIVRAVSSDAEPIKLAFPATFEKSFKRVEDAVENLAQFISLGISAKHPEDEALGKDGHTIKAEINSIEEFIRFI